jgi:hypothetical protein
MRKGSKFVALWIVNNYGDPPVKIPAWLRRCSRRTTTVRGKGGLEALVREVRETEADLRDEAVDLLELLACDRPSAAPAVDPLANDPQDEGLEPFAPMLKRALQKLGDFWVLLPRHRRRG